VQNAINLLAVMPTAMAAHCPQRSEEEKNEEERGFHLSIFHDRF
jgi:hypothetical protein